ncbi:hypothetical protein OROGR_030088 [Orobanche gracilis]
MDNSSGKENRALRMAAIRSKRSASVVVEHTPTATLPILHNSSSTNSDQSFIIDQYRSTTLHTKKSKTNASSSSQVVDLPNTLNSIGRTPLLHLKQQTNFGYSYSPQEARESRQKRIQIMRERRHHRGLLLQDENISPNILAGENLIKGSTDALERPAFSTVRQQKIARNRVPFSPLTQDSNVPSSCVSHACGFNKDTSPLMRTSTSLGHPSIHDVPDFTNPTVSKGKHAKMIGKRVAQSSNVLRSIANKQPDFNIISTNIISEHHRESNDGGAESSSTSLLTMESYRLAESIEYSDLGGPTFVCKNCNAIMWYEERAEKSRQSTNPEFSLCCMKGKVHIPFLDKPPKLLYNLITGVDSRSKNFKENIRSYNSMFSFTSIGGKVDSSLNDGNGPPNFVLSGQNYHRIGSLLPSHGTPPKFAQLYIYDTQNETANRMRFFRCY